eukprot:SAG11_NODE_283_length_11241_cov_8.234428_1_plen_55_part_00
MYLFTTANDKKNEDLNSHTGGSDWYVLSLFFKNIYIRYPDTGWQEIYWRIFGLV